MASSGSKSAETDSQDSDPLLVEAETSPFLPSSTGGDGKDSENMRNKPSSPTPLALPGSAEMDQTHSTSSSSSCGCGGKLVASFDARLQKWARYLQSSTNQDRALKFLQWTLWLVSFILKKRQSSSSSSSSNGENSSISRHSQGLRKLSVDVGFGRYVCRLLGLVGAVEAVRTDSWAASSDKNPKFMQWMGRILAWSMVGYYPAEHVAFAKWMAPEAYSRSKNGSGDRSAERWSYLSCRFWLVYVLADLTQGLVQMKELQDKLIKAKSSGQDGGDDDDKHGKRQTQLALRQTKYQLTRNALFLFPAIHWSLPNWDRHPWLPESVVNTLMWLESVVCLYQ